MMPECEQCGVRTLTVEYAIIVRDGRVWLKRHLCAMCREAYREDGKQVYTRED